MRNVQYPTTDYDQTAIHADERDPRNGASHLFTVSRGGKVVGGVQLQHGAPDAEGSTTGLFSTQLMAILIDAHEGFQTGEFKCDANEQVLHHLREAFRIAIERRDERNGRGVLGKNEA
jgi:hypothetical protein